MAHTDAHTLDIGLESPMSRNAACVHMDAPATITSMAHNGAIHVARHQTTKMRTTLRQNLSAPGVSVWVPALRPNLSARGVSVWVPALNLQYSRSGMGGSDRDVHSGAGVQTLDEQHRSEPDTYP